jgi:hypothetical protein
LPSSRGEEKMSEDRKKKGGLTIPLTEDGKKDSCKMSERDNKKKKCDHCHVPNFTKYNCPTCKGEFCSDCTNLKPANCKVILSYCGHWNCKACREEQNPERDQGRDEILARLVDMVDKLTTKVEMMGREMLQRDEKILVTTPSASYAGAASMNAGPGGRVRFVSSKEPVALMAKEQDVLERRMNVIVRGVEEISSEWKAEGYMKKAYAMEQVALIAHAKAPEYTWRDYKEAIQQCVRLGKDPTHSKRPMKVVFKPGHEKMRDGLIGGSLHPSQVNKKQGTVFRIQEDLTASQH